MITMGSKLFIERTNGDGTLDLMCRLCRAPVGKSLSESDLPAVRAAHMCSVEDLLRSASGECN